MNKARYMYFDGTLTIHVPYFDDTRSILEVDASSCT